MQKESPPLLFSINIENLFNFRNLGTDQKIGTDRLEGENGRNLKLESFLLPIFCVFLGQKSRGKWIKKREILVNSKT